MVEVPFTSSVAELFKEKRVYLDRRGHGQREPANLRFAQDFRAEAYSAVYSGGDLASMGLFSYSNSALDHRMAIGRYCSLSWGLSVLGSRHPIEWLTTSNITFDVHVSNINDFHADYGDGRFTVGQPWRLEKPFPVLGNDVAGPECHTGARCDYRRRCSGCRIFGGGKGCSSVCNCWRQPCKCHQVPVFA